MKCASSLLFLCLSVALFSQSFSPEKVYQVTGAQLNRLELDLTTAKQESATQKELLQTQAGQLEQLRSQLTTSSSLLTEAQTQLKTDSESLTTYESRTAVELVIVAILAFGLGFLF